MLTEDSLAMGVARVGQHDQLIAAGKLGELRTKDFGEPLHSLVIVGEMHELEKALFDRFLEGKAVPRPVPRLDIADAGLAAALRSAATGDVGPGAADGGAAE